MENKLIAIIRISGMVNVPKDIENSLERLRLKRKYSCVLINPNDSLLGILKKIKYRVSYGEIDKETLIHLIEKRGKSINKEKINPKKIAEDVLSGKSLKELGLKPFFRLHPPRKGIKSKLQYPKGVLGNNKEINKLIERML